jgi:hypothetical protein
LIHFEKKILLPIKASVILADRKTLDGVQRAEKHSFAQVIFKKYYYFGHIYIYSSGSFSYLTNRRWSGTLLQLLDEITNTVKRNKTARRFGVQMKLPR